MDTKIYNDKKLYNYQLPIELNNKFAEACKRNLTNKTQAFIAFMEEYIKEEEEKNNEE